MITVLVLEDEKKVYTLLSEALRKEGYSFIDEPESGGMIKIVKKKENKRGTSLGERVIALKNILLREKHGLVYKSILEDVEKPLMESILEDTEGNQLKAAKILGINRNTLRSKIKKLGIEVDKFKKE